VSHAWPGNLDDLLDGYDVTLVEVRCDPAELERREQVRGDRPAGLARSQVIDAHGDCDILVDTTRTGPEEVARVIADALPGVPVPRAFERMRVRRRSSPA
jgi:chloramphenicol 3-O phosphotransferase